MNNPYLQEKIMESYARGTSSEFKVCSDIDEVVVVIAPKLAALVMEHAPMYLLNESMVQLWRTNKEKFNQLILDRADFFMEDILLKSQYQKSHKHIVIQVFEDHQKDFYDDLELSEFGKFLQTLYTEGKITELNFLSHHKDTSCDISKTKFIERHFVGANVRVLDMSIPKSRQINDFAWDVFIEDRISNIHDVVTSLPSVSGKQFILLNYKYNEKRIQNTGGYSGFDHVSRFRGCNFTILDPYQEIKSNIITEDMLSNN